VVLLSVVEGVQVGEVVLLLVEAEEEVVEVVVELGEMPLAAELASGYFVRIRVRNDLVAKERVLHAT